MSVPEAPGVADPALGHQGRPAAGADYWLDRLTGSLPETNLLPDFLRRKSDAKSYDLVPFKLPKDLSRRTRDRAGGDLPQVFAILVAAAKLVLHKYAGQESLILGAPALATPQGHGASPSVVAILTDIAADSVIGDYVKQVSDTVQDAYRHDGLPLARLVEDLGHTDDGDRCPIFDVFVVLEDIHGRDAPGSVDTDLTLSFRTCEGHLEGELRYRSDVFAPGTIKQFITHFKRVLRFSLSDGDARVSEIPLLTRSERDAILRTSEGPVRRYPTDTPMHALFEAQARLWPDRVAAEDSTQALTYRELNESANRVANLLIQLGAKPGEFVAILHERSVTNLVFKLAALKAGGAFVPIDPSYPPDRVSYMLENSEARFLLTSSETMDRYIAAIENCEQLDFAILSDRAKGGGSPTLDVYDSGHLAASASSNPRVAASGRDTCYMIYTSGSTGVPKGAMVRHDGAVNHIYAEFEALSFTPDFSMVQSAPASSDISIWQYLGPVLIGGRVIVVDTTTVFDAQALFGVMKDKGVSIVEFVPVVLRNLLEYVAGLTPAQRALPDLKWMMATGEAVPVDLVNWWLSLYPSIRVVNAYGPSEASDDVTQMIISRPLPPVRRSVPVGQPLANCRIYIVDRNMQLVPQGAPGEICVGGICVGSGYWKNQEKTAAAFAPDPFAASAGETLYRTGDLGRWLADGSIEFIGRLDQQVKVRGFRIELEEVEAVLRQLADVRDVAARVWEDARNVKRLVAYVVLAEGKEPVLSEWRRLMMEKLPDYMVPAIFVKMDSLPIAPSGKVDRRALPEPGENVVNLQASYVPPRSPTERTLADIWAEILQVSQVGIEDNFFELGGDSILGIQVVTRACKAGIALGPSDIFSNPTIEELAAAAAAHSLRSTAPDLMPLTPGQGHVLKSAERAPDSGVTVFGLELSQPIDWPCMERAAGAVARHHAALRLRLLETATGWRQSFGETGEAVTMTETAQSAPSDEAALAAVRAAGTRLSKRLDPASDATFGVGLVDFGPARASWLLMAGHDIAVDRESWSIVVEDLETAYRQIVEGEETALPPETASFAQWVLGVTASPEPPNGSDPGAPERHVATACLTAEETGVVVGAAERMNARIEEICAAALTMTAAPTPASVPTTLGVVFSRQLGAAEELDLSRAVGRFTTPVTVSAVSEPEDDPVARLRSVKDRLRVAQAAGARSPGPENNGRDEDKGPSDARATAWHLALVPSEAMDRDAVIGGSSLFRRFASCSGEARPASTAGAEIEWRRSSGRLEFTFALDAAERSRHDVERYSQDFIGSIRRLAEHCHAADAHGYTPSDFPLSGIGQARLDALQQQFPKIEDIYPLGPAQQGIYLQCLLGGKSGAYCEQTSMDLRGGLDSAALFRAWQAVMKKYPALRTAFVRRRLPRPLQIVSSHLEASTRTLDWRHLGAQEQAEQWLELLEEDRTAHFAPDKSPLNRLTLIRLADDLHRLLLTYHHLIMDGWSEPIVLRDLFSFYRDIRSGRDGEPAVESTYRDYIAWLVRQDEGAARAFWRERLKGFASPTRLDIEKASLEAQGFASQTLRLGPDATQALQAYSRRHRLTINTVLQAAWALNMSLGSGSRDVVYGTVISGRQVPVLEVESMVGMTVNTLPVRVQIRQSESLDAMMRRLQNELFDIQEFGHSALGQIQGLSDVPRERQPLVRSLFVFANYPDAEVFGEDMDDPSVENVQLMTFPDFPMTLFAVPGGRLLLRIVYARDRFEDDDIKNALLRYVDVLDRILANPDGIMESVADPATPSAGPAQLAQSLEWISSERNS